MNHDAELELSPAFASLSTAQPEERVERGAEEEMGCVLRTGDGSATKTQRHRAEVEMGWLVSNNWLTIMATALPVFIKVFIPKGFKFFRKNTSKSVDSGRVSGS
jgi:hypothetical protein